MLRGLSAAVLSTTRWTADALSSTAVTAALQLDGCRAARYGCGEGSSSARADAITAREADVGRAGAGPMDGGATSSSRQR